MSLSLRSLVLGGLVACVTPLAVGQQPALPETRLVEVADGFTRPVEITHADDSRLFVLEQAGTIRVVRDGVLLDEPFLDISSSVGCCGERGLLGLAFPADHETTGHFFVNYTDRDGDTVIARFTTSAESPDRADPGSETVVLTVTQPFSNHNGGQLRFGPDGMLWIGMGDGGSAGDPMNNAQSLDTLLGKMLRIDVSDLPYSIPPTNPFAQGGGAPEIWSWGWRNPWRFSFDRLTGDLFAGDVGQSQWEEIDLEPAGSEGGRNYGWRLMEGRHCFNPAAGCNDGSLVLPILEYDHSEGCSVTAGFRYRGSAIPSLAGVYVYGDLCSGTIWGAREQAGEWSESILMQTSLTISSFGEDHEGELYVAAYNRGVVYRIESPGGRKRAVRRP